MILNERFLVQINDGLSEIAACGSAVAYDREYGIAAVLYNTGNHGHYGESTGKICLSMFAPSQPHNCRRRVVDYGVGESRGCLCNAIYPLGGGIFRVAFTLTKGDIAGYYRDYDFLTDSLTERREMFFRTSRGDERLTSESFRRYLGDNGFVIRNTEPPFINKVTSFDGRVYTAVTNEGWNYPVFCTIEENALVPFAIFPELNTYEFRFYADGSGIHGVSRIPPDDHGTGHCAYVRSADGGRTWEKTVFDDGVQSRPDILSYRGKPLVIYNYKSDLPTENMPPMHNHRNAVKFVHDGKVILDVFSKYGIVEHETIVIAGELYSAFSNCPLALSTENGKAWEEEGHPVEQGKEAVQWIKVGYIG